MRKLLAHLANQSYGFERLRELSLLLQQAGAGMNAPAYKSDLNHIANLGPLNESVIALCSPEFQ